MTLPVGPTFRFSSPSAACPGPVVLSLPGAPSVRHPSSRPVWEWQMTIIGILMWMMQCSQSHAWGVCSRMALGGDDDWQSNKILMFLNNHVYICGVDVGNVSEPILMNLFIFSICANHLKYSIPLCVQGVLNLCLCQHFCIGCKAMVT